METYGMVSAGESDVLIARHLSEGDIVCVSECDRSGLLALRRLARVEERIGGREGILG